MAYGKARRIGRASGAVIGAMAVKIFECNGCHAQYKAEKPAQCKACGRMDFSKIDSTAEAKRLGELRLLQHAGVISDLETQVRFPLMAFCLGRPVKVGDYIADAVYMRDGVRVIEDTKPSVMTDVAAFKLRFMAAMGMPVTIHQKKG